MKRFYVSLIVSSFLFNIIGNAQVLSKGNFVIGTTMGFSTSDSKVSLESTNSNAEGDGPSATQISFAPNIGYFVVENFALGIGMDYTFGSVKEPNLDEVTDSDLLFGPFFRYYIPTDNDAAFFFQTDFGFGSSSDQQYIGTSIQSIDSNIFAIGAGPGFTIFSNNAIGVEALFKYNFARSKFNTQSGGVSTTTTTKTNQYDLSIGIQFYFESLKSAGR